jgi:hypothetical protein
MALRQAGLELFRILALTSAHQRHLIQVRDFFNGVLHTWHWEYCVLLVCALGFTMTGLFQMSTVFSLRAPFRAKALVFFCLALKAQGELLAFLLHLLGLPNHRLNRKIQYPISGRLSWFFTAHSLMTLMMPILNGGLLALTKRVYGYVEIAIVIVIIWFGPAGLVIHGNGFNWENACLLSVFAGFFGIHGWPFRPGITWMIFLVILTIDRLLMTFDIFDKISTEWHWALVTFRLHILHRGNTYVYSSSSFVGYVCPLNYLWGVVALYAFRTLSFHSELSKVICFLAIKVFMIHLLDSLIWIYGHRLQNLVRPWERVNPPWKGNLNAGLVTIQALSYGTLAEIYRDRVFMHFFNATTSMLGSAFDILHNIYLRFWNSNFTRCNSEKESALGWLAFFQYPSLRQPRKIMQYTSLR